MKEIFLFSFVLIFSSACTDRNVEIGFLSDYLREKAEFSIDNLQGENDLLPNLSNNTVPLQITCQSSVSSFEVQDPTTKVWKTVGELIPGGTFSCDTGKVLLDLPLSVVAPFVSPTAPGDVRSSFQVRWQIKYRDGTIFGYNRVLSVLFKAPTVEFLAPHINKQSHATTYTVSGTCSESGSTVVVSSPVSESSASGSCVGGAFGVSLTLLSPLSLSSANITVKHFSAGEVPRAFAQVEKNILIDRIDPIVAVTSPATEEVLNTSSINADGSIHIQGECSETMSALKIYINNTESATVTCSSAQGFAADIIVPEGNFTLKVSQTDAVGNIGYSSLVNLTKDTTPPSPFTITGVTSTDGVDTVSDGVLGGYGLIVNLSSSAGAVSYDVFVKNSAGTITVCPLQTFNSTSGSFSCTLSNATDFKIYASSKDAGGNTTLASNAGFSFRTQYSLKITSIYSNVAANTTYTQGQVIYLYVEFNRDISVAGSPLANLNVGVAVSYHSKAYPNTLKFEYTVVSNQYTPQLAVTSLNLNGGTISYSLDSTVPANLEFTDSGTDANFLKSENIKIDSKVPNPVSGLSLGIAPANILYSPNIIFVTPTDPDNLISYIRVIDPSTNAVLSDWVSVNSGSGVPLGGNLLPGTLYRVDVKVVDPAGNESSVVSANYTSFACPNNFTYVYNQQAGVNPFCIATFEAKGTLASPQFVATGAPLSSISPSQAHSSCSGLGANYGLPSNAEWNVLAELIRQQASNWTGGSVGSGILHRGNTALAVSPSSVDTAQPCFPMTDTSICASSGYRRISYLPYGQSIWDISGNVWEVTSDTDSNTYSPSSDWVVSLGSSSLGLKYGTTASCSSPSSPDYCGFGKLDFASAGSSVWRGGAAYAGNMSGVYAAVRSASASSNAGFRCVYRP